MRIAQLTPVDLVLMATVLVLTVGIGWWARARSRTASDFLDAARSMPAWVSGLAVLSANVGVIEVIGMGAAGARYGFAAAHFFWLGAIPAMVVAGLFVIPVYHRSGARSVPEYLKLRFDEKTRTVAVIAQSVLMVASAGVALYVVGQTFRVVLGWDFGIVVLGAGAIVLAYLLIGGLAGAMYSGALHVVLLVAGLVPVVVLGMAATDGWRLLVHRLSQSAINSQLPPAIYTHLWKGMGHPLTNSFGVEGVTLVMGLGVVLSFGYWCTDFRVIQRAMAARSELAARRASMVAAAIKLLLPAILILPGALAIMLGGGESGAPFGGMGQGLIPGRRGADGSAVLTAVGRTVLDYDVATPLLIVSILPAGLMGLALAALLAAFMSGMAASVTAFTTIWCRDVYQVHLSPGATDRHILRAGRAATVGAIALAILIAHIARSYDSLLDFLPLVFAFVHAPLLATVALGMFWRRTTGHGAFAGLLAGVVAALAHHGVSLAPGSVPGVRGGFVTVLLPYRSVLAQVFVTAIVAWGAGLVVTVAVSRFTSPRPAAELDGLVYARGPRPGEQGVAWWGRPAPMAGVIVGAAVVLNVLFA